MRSVTVKAAAFTSVQEVVQLGRVAWSAGRARGMTKTTSSATEDMCFVTGGAFWMGSDEYYPEEAPSRQERVNGFWIDRTPVTNQQFEEYVTDTGYVTEAEQMSDAEQYRGADPSMMRPGSALFVAPDKPVRLDDPTQWWQFRFGADWRHPLGPDSGLDALGEHPVVHIAYSDACAYAAWAGKSLPTEVEWEFAARGGLDRQPYAWGDELEPSGTIMANYWQGTFPIGNATPKERTRTRTTAVGQFAPNGYHLLDMIGNVWEWTCDDYPAAARGRWVPRSCCISPGTRPVTVRKVIKGGSHLCAPNYCQRYRPAARHPQDIDTSTSHLGFRCVIRDS
jgi:sulfatase modifying factor 1